MEASLATCFPSQVCCYGEGFNSKLGTLRFYPYHAHRLLPATCKMRHRRDFEKIANQFQNHDHARLMLKYDESLSHLIYAASDMLIIPSIFEPCGLTQMIAMRYGTILIVRKTGGLNDSVFDVDNDSKPKEFIYGFTFFFSTDEQGFNIAFERAFSYHSNNREFWQQLVEKAMKIDFSWKSSAAVYEELYEKAVAGDSAANRASS